MDYTDNDMYDREEMSDTPGKDDAAPQPAKTKARSAPARAGAAPEQEKAPQLLLAAGNTQEKDAAPTQDDAKPRTSSGKASQASDKDKAAARPQADEDKPGIVFDGKAV